MRRLFLTLILCLLTTPTWAAISCGTRSSLSGSGSSPANPMTVTFTPDAGSDRIQHVFIHLRDAAGDDVTVSSVASDAGGTWNSYGELRADIGAQDVAVAWYYSTDFADGSQTLSVTTSSALFTGGVETLTCTGVDTASPFRNTVASNEGTTETEASVDVTSVASTDLVIAVLSAGTLNAGVNPTLGANQTSLYNTPRGTDNLDTAASTETGTGTITMSWDTMTGVDAWAILAGALKETPSAAFGPLRRRF